MHKQRTMHKSHTTNPAPPPCQVGCSEIVGRIVEDLKDESEPYRRMVMETIDKIVGKLGTADIDARLEELLVDGILYAFQVCWCFGVLVYWYVGVLVVGVLLCCGWGWGMYVRMGYVWGGTCEQGMPVDANTIIIIAMHTHHRYTHHFHQPLHTPLYTPPTHASHTTQHPPLHTPLLRSKSLMMHG